MTTVKDICQPNNCCEGSQKIIVFTGGIAKDLGFAWMFRVIVCARKFII
jgi:hypothetical protein